MFAINLQRGREHGIPSYNEYRKACGLRGLTSWSNRPKEHESEYWKQLEKVYESVYDIDLYAGAIAETGVRGGAVGPTFACLISEQFDRLKRGDRFFYTHTNANGLSKVAKGNFLTIEMNTPYMLSYISNFLSIKFTSSIMLILEQVLSRTMADVLCDVTQLSQVQKWVTLQPNRNYNTYKACHTNHKLDMRAIADEISKELLGNDRDSRRFRAGNGGRFPERTRSGSGRSISGNRLRNSIVKTQRPRKLTSAERAIENQPKPQSVRFVKADAIQAPPQVTRQSLKSTRSGLATGGIGDSRFRSGGRPSVNTKPRRSENSFSFSENPRGFRPQVAVNSFIEQQKGFSENTFSLRERRPNSNGKVRSSNRQKNSSRFVPNSDCLFGICR